MMKRISFIFFCGVLLLFFIEYLVIINRDYKEKQRALFNQIFTYAVDTRPMQVNTAEVISNEKYHYYNQELNLLREAEAPDWKVNIGQDLSSSHLPMEALTIPELKERAEKLNDADTCLHLATRGGVDYPFHIIHNAKKWLKKAVNRGRPGADFLLKIILEQESRLPEQLPLLGRSAFSSPPPLKNLEYLSYLNGYESFMTLIRQGDFELYKVLQFFEPVIAESSLTEEMRQALKKKARTGDHTARRNLAELELRPLFHRDVTRTIPDGKKYASDIPLKWQSMYKTALTATRELKRLADDGDVQAMHLWLKYGLRFEDGYDYKTWRDLFDFTDILLQQGYADVLTVMKVPSLYGSVWFEQFPWGLVKASYTEASSIEAGRKSLDELKKRGDVHVLYYDILTQAVNYRLGTQDRAEKTINLPRLEDDMAAFLQMYGIQRILLESHLLQQEGRNNIMNFLNEQASAGYPEANLALGDIWKRGSTGKKDLKMALSYFERAWQKRVKYNADLLVFSFYENGEIRNLPSNMAAECVVELMDLYLTKDSPLKNEAKAFELAKEYAGATGTSEKTHKLQENSFFLLGQLYEKGIGVDVNREKAIECYQQGIIRYEDSASYAALDELSKQAPVPEEAVRLLKDGRKGLPPVELSAIWRLKAILNTWKNKL